MAIDIGVLKRIMTKVIPKLEGCWRWEGATIGGYPAIHVRDRSSRVQLAHQIVCELYHGDRPEGKEVRHLCNTKVCLNPAHLCWGNRSENMLDFPPEERVRNIHNAAIASAKARRRRTRNGL